jgi:uncharacterized pyridoxal phosphate-containing UPF0001 family protein
MSRVGQVAKNPDRVVTLVAVSKAQSVQAIREAYAAGQHRFAENYVQEALEKCCN